MKNLEFIKNYRCVFTIEKKEEECIVIKTDVFRRDDGLLIESISTTFSFKKSNYFMEMVNKKIKNLPASWENIIEAGKREHLNYIVLRANIEDFNSLDLKNDIFMFYL